MQVLLDRGYPKAADLTETAFVRLVEQARSGLDALASENGAIPFVLVVTGEVVPVRRTLELVVREGRRALTMLAEDELGRFAPIEAVRLPAASVYLAVGVDTGEDTRNVTPDDALERLLRRRRSPLTIEEGIALVTQHPHAVAKGAGFSLLGSRCGDRRVPAFWISKGRPKLGWCWAGNPHTWLGSASCATRIGRGR